MKKYENLEIRGLFLSQCDIVTASGDGEPILPNTNESIWGDFYN